MEREGQQNRRHVVRSCASHSEAQRAVDALSDNGFPVERLSIVAEDLRFVEDITGRRDFGVAAGQGLLTGAVVGALIGFFFGLFSLVDPLVSAFALAGSGVLFGAVLGAIFGIVAHAVSGGRSDFSSDNRIEAGRYDVVADEDVAAEAARLLDRELAPAVTGNRVR